jgi:hypothetical protein
VTGGKVRLAFHRIWRPSKSAPLDLEATIESYLRQVCQQYRVHRIICDPYQLHRSIMTLKVAGLPIEEFPQTTANTVRMGQSLYDLLKGRNLAVYPDAELREQALNAVAIENPAGYRLAKEKASKKIDGIVALAMACVAALDHPASRPLGFSCGGQSLVMSDEAPCDTASITVAPGVVACPIAESTASLTEQVRQIRQKPLLQRTQEEHQLVAQYFESQEQQLNALDPLSRAARCGGYIPGEGTPDLEADLQEVDAMFRRWR